MAGAAAIAAMPLVSAKPAGKVFIQSDVTNHPTLFAANPAGTPCSARSPM